MITEHAASIALSCMVGPISLPRGRLTVNRILLTASPYSQWQRACTYSHLYRLISINLMDRVWIVHVHIKNTQTPLQKKLNLY